MLEMGIANLKPHHRPSKPLPRLVERDPLHISHKIDEIVELRIDLSSITRSGATFTRYQ